MSHARLSTVLAALADDCAPERVSVADLLVALGDRALGALLFVFAFPNVLPMPPGASAVFGAPLVFLAAQLALGMRPWLPALIQRRSMAKRDFAALVWRVNPWLIRAERLLRPRFSAFAHPPMEYLIGAICLLLALIVLLPIPLGNMLPALAICLLGLAVLSRDGICALLGLLAAAAALALVSGVVWAMLQTALYFFKHLLG